jgi:hypothetical protein
MLELLTEELILDDWFYLFIFFSFLVDPIGLLRLIDIGEELFLYFDLLGR